MGFFSKTTIEKINKYFKEKEITLEKKDDIYSFMITYDTFSVEPYFKVDSNDYITMNVNLRMIDEKKFDYKTINDFNLNSPFFKAMVSDNNIIYLEYVFKIDDVEELFDSIIDSLVSLKNEIDSL